MTVYIIAQLKFTRRELMPNHPTKDRPDTPQKERRKGATYGSFVTFQELNS